MIYGQAITFGGSGGKSPFPAFTYTGRYGLLDDGDGNWRIKFLSSGVFTPEKDMVIDVFLVGGGGGGGCTNGNSSTYRYGGGGGGGYTATHRNIVLTAGTRHTVTIGAGGVPRIGGGTGEGGNAGGSTSFDALTVAGGSGGPCHPAGSPTSMGGQALNANGGSGGAGYLGVGGSDGSAGTGTYPGAGQGTTTREFGESTGDLYAGGGGSGSASSTRYAGGSGGGGAGAQYYGISTLTTVSAEPGEANTGGGGGGGCDDGRAIAAWGGCGVVVIRNARAA